MIPSKLVFAILAVREETNTGSEEIKMMFKCCECGRVFDETERAEWYEPHGEKMDGCPNCKGDYEEAFKCELCGEIHFASERTEGVCDACIDEYKDDHEMCFRVGSHGKDAVLLNSFIAEMFDAELIEQVMFDFWKTSILGTTRDCSKFILSDKNFFAENLIEEVNK
jgi:hypothetical protein